MKETQAQRKLGEAIRKRRTRLGTSQEDFADKITMHRTFYGSIERGKRNITLKSILRIADGLNTKAAELFEDAGL